MNEGLIQRWNSKIKKDDIVYHLGDLSFTNPKRMPEILERLNGRKNLIRGNHDHKIETYSHLLESVRDYREIRMEGEYIILFHFPISSWHGAHRGSWHLHGHSHGTHKTSLPFSNQHGKRMDVGVDCWDWYPISLEEVREKFAAVAPAKVDHHDPMDPRRCLPSPSQPCSSARNPNTMTASSS